MKYTPNILRVPLSVLRYALSQTISHFMETVSEKWDVS